MARLRKEAEMGLHGRAAKKRALAEKSANGHSNGATGKSKLFSYSGVNITPEDVQSLREELHVYVDRYFDRAFGLGCTMGRAQMTERLGELTTEMEFEVYGEPHQKSPVKKKRRLKTDSKGQKFDKATGDPVKVNHAATLQGRYMGFMNTVSKGDAEKAKQIRAEGGLDKALRFLEKKRKSSAGKAKGKSKN
jgi:hypothetical protein